MLFWKKRFKKFRSEHGWFEMEVPINWEQYDDEEGTYAFFDPKKWKGNFRITPLNVNKAIDNDFLDSYFEKGYKEKYIGEYTCAYLEEYNKEENLIIHNWYFYKDDLFFLSSYTTNIKFENTSTTSKELAKVEAVIKSINLL